MDEAKQQAWSAGRRRCGEFTALVDRAVERASGAVDKMQA
jgi:hypothetical protein